MIILLIVVVFVVIVALIGGWGGESSSMIKGLQQWFGQVLSGGYKLPTESGAQGGTSGTGVAGLPGIGNAKSP